MRRSWIVLLLISIPGGALSATAPGPSALSGPALSVVRSPDGTDLLVAQAGDPAAPGILMIHGYAQSYLSFRRQLDSDLVKRFHLVAFDLRGHGGSAKPSDPAAYTDRARSADDVAAVMAATGLHRPVVVAWSYGGIVVGDYVRKFGVANLAAVAFVGTLGGLVKPAEMPVSAVPKTYAGQAAAIKAASLAGRSLDVAQNISGGDVISRAYLTPAMTASDLRILFATEMMLPAYARRASALRSTDNSDLVGAFKAMPTLFVRGELELGMGEGELATLTARLPRSQQSRYPGIGHLTFFEAPVRFNAELAAFTDAAPARSLDPAAAVPRPNLPMSALAHRAFRLQEFMARDTNSNGVLEQTEIAAASGEPLSADATARAIRINCGADLPNCPLARFQAQGDLEFRRVDGDRDNTVTRDELAAAGGSFHVEQP